MEKRLWFPIGNGVFQFFARVLTSWYPEKGLRWEIEFFGRFKSISFVIFYVFLSKSLRQIDILFNERKKLLSIRKLNFSI